MSDSVARRVTPRVLGFEEPRTCQQREMARLWMALDALRQAEPASAPARPLAGAQAILGFSPAWAAVPSSFAGPG